MYVTITQQYNCNMYVTITQQYNCNMYVTLQLYIIVILNGKLHLTSIYVT